MQTVLIKREVLIEEEGFHCVCALGWLLHLPNLVCDCTCTCVMYVEMSCDLWGEGVIP